jgi:ABC-type ATPase with predicted acetyltransferase domain
VVEALARFGMVELPERRRLDHTHARRLAAELVTTLAPGEVALLTGPSGSGKSTLLAALATECADRGGRLLTGGVPRQRRSRRALEVIPLPTAQALEVLHAAGLGEPIVWARRVRELSCGERARLDAAWLLARADAGAWVAIDEFTSALDRITARSVCVGVRRLARTRRVPLVVATAHHDVAAWLTPEVLVHIELSGEARLTRLTEARTRAAIGGVSCTA